MKKLFCFTGLVVVFMLFSFLSLSFAEKFDWNNLPPGQAEKAKLTTVDPRSLGYNKGAVYKVKGEDENSFCDFYRYTDWQGGWYFYEVVETYCYQLAETRGKHVILSQKGILAWNGKEKGRMDPATNWKTDMVNKDGVTFRENTAYRYEGYLDFKKPVKKAGVITAKIPHLKGGGNDVFALSVKTDDLNVFISNIEGRVYCNAKITYTIWPLYEANIYPGAIVTIAIHGLSDTMSAAIYTDEWDNLNFSLELTSDQMAAIIAAQSENAWDYVQVNGYSLLVSNYYWQPCQP